MTHMTREQFMAKEIAAWGEDHIFDLLDRGYAVIELTDNRGNVKWTWYFVGLTNAPDCATLKSGSDVEFTPVYSTYRASRTNAT